MAVAFLQCGTWMVFMLYSFNMSPAFYHLTSVGPQVLACGGAVIAGLLLSLLRLWKGRVVFIHFFLILGSSVLLFLVGFLSLVDSGKSERPLFLYASRGGDLSDNFSAALSIRPKWPLS